MAKTDVRYQLCRLSISDTLEVNAAVCYNVDSTVIQIKFLDPLRQLYFHSFVTIMNEK